MSKPILYFDMDNVLVDFASGLAKVSDDVRRLYERDSAVSLITMISGYIRADGADERCCRSSGAT